jgi:hypothetical protein
MRVDNDILGDGRRNQTQKEPKQQSTMCSLKSKEKEKEKGKTQKKINFSQEILSSKRISTELKSKQQIPNYETPHLSGSPSSRLIRGPRPMMPTTKKMIQWIGGPRAMSSANKTRTDPTTRTLPLMGISLSHFDCPLFI